MTFNINFEEMKKRLDDLDKRTLDERTERSVALGGVIISLVDRPFPNLMEEYRREARDSYVNGNYRSCIFNCSAVFDQIIRHEYIARESDPQKGLQNVERETLGSMINKYINDIPSLIHLKNEFSWMNKARNTISVHPICIINPDIDEHLTNIQKADYIQQILEMLDEPTRKKILRQELHYPDRSISLKSVLDDPTSIDAQLFFIWDEHNRLVKHVAYKAYKILIDVLIELFPAEL